MPQKIDGFERFRDETLTEREQGLLNAAREPEAKVEAHKEIARERARAQLRDKPALPEEVEPSIRCPGVDPMGRFSIIDMKFAQRMDAVEGSLSIRSEEVQKRVRAVLQACTTRSTTNPLYAAYSDMQAAAEEHRILTRAGKLCLDSTGREELNRQSRDLEVDPRVVRFDKLMQGIEYLAGVRLGEVPQEIMEFFNTELRVPLSQELAEEGRQVSQQLPQVAVEFKNIENKVLLQAMANPHNWDKSWEEMQAISQNTLSVEAVSSGLSSYAAATANRLVTPMFQQMEQYTQGMVNRADLISIDGKTVRELAQEQFAASRQTGSFDDFFRQNSVRMTNELVAAGLMAGKRVEAFVPDKYGQVPKEPTQITKSGYEPSPLKPEHFNAWQRFFSRRGFYKEKVARQAEYDKVMGARDRMRKSAEQGAVRARLGRLKATMDRSAQFDVRERKGLFFDEIMAEHGCAQVTTDAAGNTTTTYKWGDMNKKMRDEHKGVDEAFLGFGRTEAADMCILHMLGEGHKFQDILDPGKLQAERHAAARLYMDKLEKNDAAWLGQTCYKGYKAIIQQFEDATRGVDFNNENQRLAVLPLASGITLCGFHASQFLGKSTACQQAYLLEAVKDTALPLAEASQRANEMNEFFTSAGDAMSVFKSEVSTQLALADPMKTIVPEKCADALGTAQMIRQTMRTGWPAVRAFPSRDQQNEYGAAAAAPDSALLTALKEAVTPEQRTATALAAASGRLTDGLRITGYNREPVMDRKTNQPALRTADHWRLTQDENGAYSVQTVKVPIGSMHRGAMKFQLGGALAGPKPELRQDGPKQDGPAQDAPRQNAPKQEAPRKQASQKTAKPGGLSL